MTAAASGRRDEVVQLVVGRFSPRIGGPYQTLLAYKTWLEKAGHRVDVLAMKPHDGTAVAETEWARFLPDGWRLWRDLFVESRRSANNIVVVFGVWHPVFFAFGTLAAIRRRSVSGRRVLVPTQSLSRWDWRKHRVVKTLLRPAVNRIVASFDAVLFATRGEMETSIPQVPHSSGVVIYHPIATVDRGLSAGAGTKSVAFLARLTPQKDAELFIRVIARLPQEWHAHIIGAGEAAYVAKLKRLADVVGCGERVTWHGWLPRSEAHAILRRTGALIVTSRAENYCHAAVEAMSLRVPVVIVDRVAASIDMRERGTAAVVSSVDVELADAVLRLHRGSDERDALVRRAEAFGRDRERGADMPKLISIVTGRALTGSASG